MASKITKAVVPVAGWSTRFLPTVKAYAKHLVPILDKPQIQLVVEELVGAGINDICIVHRPDETTIKSYFEHHSKLEDYLETVNKTNLLSDLNQLIDQIKFTFIPQDPSLPYGNGTPLISAKEFIGSDSFVYAWGDDLTIEDKPGNFLSALIDTFSKYSPAVILATQEFPADFIDRLGSMRYVDDPVYPHRINGIFEKLKASEAFSLFGNCARFVVDPKIIAILEQKQLGLGNELWFTGAVNQLAQTDVVMTVDHREYDSEWVTTGDPQNWLEVNLRLALQRPDYTEKIKKHLSS